MTRPSDPQSSGKRESYIRASLDFTNGEQALLQAVAKRYNQSWQNFIFLSALAVAADSSQRDALAARLTFADRACFRALCRGISTLPFDFA